MKAAMAVVIVATLALVMAAFSGGNARNVTASYPGCTQPDPLFTAWFQVLMDDDDAGDREILGLTHLKNQQVRALGDQPGDHEICYQLFQSLGERYRGFVTAVPPEANVFYYAVGDRYLVGIVSDVTISLWSIVFSFDLEFNRLGSMI